MSNGYSLLATYTWSHVLDDAPTSLGTTGEGGYRQSNLVPIKTDWASTGFDTRHRVTFNAYYDLPFGIGRKFANHSRVLDAVIGGWSTNTTWVAQTGNLFTVYSSGISTAAGGGPFKPAQTDASLNLDASCATSLAPGATTRTTERMSHRSTAARLRADPRPHVAREDWQRADVHFPKPRAGDTDKAYVWKSSQSLQESLDNVLNAYFRYLPQGDRNGSTITTSFAPLTLTGGTPWIGADGGLAEFLGSSSRFEALRIVKRSEAQWAN